MRKRRVLLYVQHLLGIGHLRRAVRLTDALTDAGAEVCCVSGGMAVPDLTPREGHFEQLPAARAADGRFKALVDVDGQPIDAAWRDARRAHLMRLYEQYAPDIVVTESFPFGRRLLRFELEPLVDAVVRDPRQRLVTSVRDILEGYDKPTVRAARAVREITSWYDLVLVHGDPAWVDLSATFVGAPNVAERLRYTGYITDLRISPVLRDATPDGVTRVLVSTGGGAVGAGLASAAIDAATVAGAQARWHVLVGHNLPQASFEALRARAGHRVLVERNRADFLELLQRASVSVSQAGYNTVAEVLATGVPAVLVPYVADGQYEQTLRASVLADRERAVMLPDSELRGPDAGPVLWRAVEQACNRRCNTAAGVALDGARRAAEALMALALC